MRAQIRPIPLQPGKSAWFSRAAQITSPGQAFPIVFTALVAQPMCSVRGQLWLARCSPRLRKTITMMPFGLARPQFTIEYPSGSLKPLSGTKDYLRPSYHV